MKFKTKKDDCPNVRKVKYNTLESSYIFVTPLHLLITKAHNNRLFGDIDEWDFQDNTNERNNLLWKKIFNIFMKYGGDVNALALCGMRLMVDTLWPGLFCASLFACFMCSLALCGMCPLHYISKTLL